MSTWTPLVHVRLPRQQGQSPAPSAYAGPPLHLGAGGGRPRLRVWRFGRLDGEWMHEVIASDRRLLDSGRHPTWREALAVGLAALDAAAFTCPRCGRTSWHPEDKRQGYCGACHDFTGPGGESGVLRCPQCGALTGPSGVCPACGWWPR